eukprot:159877-Rhodomonas_salina.2
MQLSQEGAADAAYPSTPGLPVRRTNFERRSSLASAKPCLCEGRNMLRQRLPAGCALFGRHCRVALLCKSGTDALGWFHLFFGLRRPSDRVLPKLKGVPERLTHR